MTSCTSGTRAAHYVKGFWKHPVPGGMHYQGRRWGGEDGTDIYEARATFESYGVPYATTAEARTALIRAVPESHKAFLRDLLWVRESGCQLPLARARAPYQYVVLSV